MLVGPSVTVVSKVVSSNAKQETGLQSFTEWIETLGCSGWRTTLTPPMRTQDTKATRCCLNKHVWLFLNTTNDNMCLFLVRAFLS